jgi:hypothetical protein
MAAPRKTYCVRGHKLSPENVYVYGKDRVCKSCCAIRGKEAWKDLTKRQHKLAVARKWVKSRYDAGFCKCGKSIQGTVKCKNCLAKDRSRYRSNSRFELKKEVLAHYGPNGTCRCSWIFCGITDIDMLSIDHIDNSGGHERRTTSYSGGMTFYAKLKRNGYPPGFQTLCHNHQWKKEILRRREQLAADNSASSLNISLSA